MHEYRVLVRQECECMYICWWAPRWTKQWMGQVRGPRIWSGMLNWLRVYAGIQGNFDYACVCESREWQQCAVNSELQSLPAKEEEGYLDVCVHVLCHYAGVIEGSVLSVAACVADHVSVLCVSLCVRVCVPLGYNLNFATSWTCKQKSSAHFCQPGMDTLGIMAELQQPDRKNFWTRRC